ncbi:MAG TPA: SymE family type I addiction module toxin [Verrucomicrobiae bacterium]|jgi:hypothetical protein
MNSTTRILKIEADGDRWTGAIKPKIRMIGKWLEQAGFKPGNSVSVHCIGQGTIELRSHDVSTQKDAKPLGMS